MSEQEQGLGNLFSRMPGFRIRGPRLLARRQGRYQRGDRTAPGHSYGKRGRFPWALLQLVIYKPRNLVCVYVISH